MEKKKASTMAKRARAPRPQAATRDVLSPPPRPAKIDPKWRKHYRRLQDLREFFSRQKQSLVHDANEEAPNYSEHMADAGTDSYDRDFALGILSSHQNALYEIDDAIRRIESGTYGICEASGKPIPLKRLEAVPWARFTLEAEKQMEQRGGGNRARLGNLGSLTDVGESGGGTGEPAAEGEES